MTDPEPTPEPNRRWTTLLSQTTQALFLLSSNRRIRFVNAAWESITGLPAAEAIGRACLRRGPTSDLFRTLAPPPEAMAGRTLTVRRAVPPQPSGPPWWEITFVPLVRSEQVSGFLGILVPLGVTGAGVRSDVPASLASVRDRHGRAYSRDLLGGTRPEQERFLNRVHHAAVSDVPVWISGEPGSGKETLARIIHQTGSSGGRCFVGLDCAGAPPFLVESTLFGRGSLGTSGRIGTLFLKAPESLPRDVQRQFVTWLTGAGAKPRLICGSEMLPEAGVSSGRLLPEFQIHFSVLEFSMPPLRDRRPEFAGIVESLQPRLIRADGSMATVSPEAVTVLQGWTWPGNFRELITVLGDALEAVESGPILPAHLPRWLREKAAIAADPPVKEGPGPNLDAILELVEQRLIARALTKHRNNVTKAAEWLGIPRIRLVRRIEALKPGTAGPITREG